MITDNINNETDEPFDISNIIVKNFGGGQVQEIEKWLDQGVLEGTFQTLCDVRRSIELVFGEGEKSNFEILDGIMKSGGIITNRPESEIQDYCFVDIPYLINLLDNKIK